MRNTMSLHHFFLIGCLLAAGLPAAAQNPASGIPERLDRIERLIQSQGLLDMLTQLESLQQEIMSLRGELELQNHTIEQIQQRQRALYTDIDQRMRNIEQPGSASGQPLAMQPQGGSRLPGETLPGEEPPLQTLTPVYNPVQPPGGASDTAALEIVDMETGTPDAPGGNQPEDAPVALAPVTRQPGPAPLSLPGALPPQTGTLPRMVMAPVQEGSAAATDPGLTQAAAIDPAEARVAYDRAFALLKEAQYEPAIQAFRDFQARYAGSEYGDNAQYWLGEAYYVMRRFPEAINEYQNLVETYPASQKYTHALLKIGYSYQELGMLEDARRYLQELVQNHPGSTASRLAAERLQQLAIRQQQTPPVAN